MDKSRSEAFGLVLAIVGLASSGGSALASDQLLPAGNCPFTLGVTPSMRAQGDPFGGLDAMSTSYRATQEKDALRVSYTQRSGATRIVYSIRCSAADPAKWLSRFGGDEASVCAKVNTFPDAERKANAYCALTIKNGARVLVSGTWSKQADSADLVRGRARFTAAQAGVGMISGRVSVTSTDGKQAKDLAEQLVATLGAAKPAN